MSKKIYFNKAQNTSEKTITKFWFNRFDVNYNNLDFLVDKIKKLVKSEKTTDSVKKQLTRLIDFDFTKYDCFYIYSNKLCFGINSESKTIDFYDSDFDSIINLKDFTKNYNCKIATKKSTKSQKQNDSVDSSVFGSTESQQ